MASVRTLTPEEVEKADGLWHQQISQAIVDETSKLDQLSAYMKELQETGSLLDTLPDRINYDVMVPFGRVAMFPGRMIHTNELLVLLGQDVFVEASAKQTRAILKRREEYTESQMDLVSRQLDSLKSRLSFSEPSFNEDGEEVKDIVEAYDEAIHGPLDRPALPRRESPRQPRSAEEAEEDEAWWRAFREQAAVAAQEEAAELAEEAAARGQPTLEPASALSADSDPAQERSAVQLGFDPFEDAPDSDDEASPRPPQGEAPNGALSSSEGAAGQAGYGDASAPEAGPGGEPQAGSAALEAELARLMAAFETAVPGESAQNGEREIIIPSQAAKPSPSEARSPLIEDLGPASGTGRLPRDKQPQSAVPAQQGTENARQRSSAALDNAQAGTLNPSAPAAAEPVSKGRSPAKTQASTAPRQGVRRGFFDSRKSAAKPKGILKKQSPPEPSVQAPQRAEQQGPKLSQELLARSEPTEAQLAAFSGVVEERSAHGGKASTSTSSASVVQQPSTAQPPGTARQPLSKLEEAKRLASLSSTAEEEQAHDVQYIDTQTNKPVSKFKARLLKSRGEL